jgi:hypothetical protein
MSKKIDQQLIDKRQRKGKGRKANYRNKREFWLIVCEGTKTEPNYFNAIVRNFPPRMLEVLAVEVEGTGMNTTSLIEKAKELRDEKAKFHGRKFDQTWVVFDRDSFPARNFNDAIANAAKAVPAIHCAWTNEAFELWYLLHFNYYDSGINRKQYQAKLEAAMRAAGNKGFSYEKNAIDMHALLAKYGNQAFAVKNAQKLMRCYGDQDYASHNPCTTVHLLVEALNRLGLKQF